MDTDKLATTEALKDNIIRVIGKIPAESGAKLNLSNGSPYVQLQSTFVCNYLQKLMVDITLPVQIKFHTFFFISVAVRSFIFNLSEHDI